MRKPTENQNMKNISHRRTVRWARRVAKRIIDHKAINKRCYIYPVKRGGVPAAYLVMSQLFLLDDDMYVFICDDPSIADVIIDDLVDTGHTKHWYKAQYPNIPFMALTKKRDNNDWYVFPWEDQDYHHDVLPQSDNSDADREAVDKIMDAFVTAPAGSRLVVSINPHHD